MTIVMYLDIRDNCVLKILYYNIFKSLKCEKIIDAIVSSEKYFDVILIKHMLIILSVVIIIDYIQNIEWAIFLNLLLLLLLYKMNIGMEKRCLINGLVINSFPLLVIIDMIFRTTLTGVNDIIQGREQDPLYIVIITTVNFMIAVLIGIIWCWKFIDFYFIVDKNKKKLVYIFMLTLQLIMIMIGFGVTDIVCDKDYRTKVERQITNKNLVMWSGWAISHAALPIISVKDEIQKNLELKSDNVHMKVDSYMYKNGIYIVETMFVILIIYIYNQMLSGV